MKAAELVMRNANDPKVCFIDIESTPLVGVAWRKWNPDSIYVTQDSYILSVAYKWMGDEEATVISLPQFKTAYKRNKSDDSRLLKKIWEIENEADVLVAHNLLSFDLKKIHAGYLRNGFAKPKKAHTVDTLRVLKREMKLTSNRLDDVCQTLNIGEKLPHAGMSMWLACMEGDPEAWEDMCRYNLHDVDPLLEGLYYFLRDNNWIGSSHPNLATATGRVAACPTCGQDSGYVKRGWTNTNTQRYQQVQFKNCGHYGSLRRSEPYTSPLFTTRG